MLRAVICDWNRTLLRDEYEIEFFRGLARCAARNFLGGLNLTRLYRLWGAKKRCEALYRRTTGVREAFQKGTFETILELMNRAVIKGFPTEKLDRYLLDYAAEAQYRLDHRLLNPLVKAQRERGVLLGIISSGCDIAIMQTLRASSCSFDIVRANCFQRNGDQIEAFALDIYENKLGVLRAILTEKKLEPEVVMYIGDDWQDEACLRAVRFPVVSFFADPKSRIALKKEVGAYAPHDAEEFDRYLNEALA